MGGSRPALPGLIGLWAIAGFWLWRGRPAAAAVAAGAAFLLVQMAVVRPAAVRRVTRVLARIGSAFGAVLSVVVLGTTWLVVIVPVALLNRLLRIDLLEHGDARGWHPVALAGRPRRPYRRDQRLSGNIGRRVLRLSVVLLPVLAIGWAVVDRATTVPPPPITPFGERADGEPAGVIYTDQWATYHDVPVSRHLFPGEPWGAEVLRVHDRRPPCDAVNVGSMDNEALDLATEHVNVVDGRRRTFTVPRAERTVWMFGGSTTYGVGQRDDHTIASALVRLALAEGLRLEVVNLGCPGKVNWSETEQFEFLLRTGEPAPDAAIFLDGINEWARAFTREEVGLLDASVPFAGYASADQQDALLAAARARGYVATHDPERHVRLASEQYRIGVERSRTVAREFDVPVVHFWQPALFTMPTSAPGNSTAYHSDDIDPASAAGSGRYYRQAAEQSGVGPIDLMDIFDDADQPLFFDCCHTNEAGARLEAEAMYPFVVAALDP